MKIDHNYNGRFARPGDKVDLGRITITNAALEVVGENESADAVRSHAEGNWGLVDAKDWEANERALTNGGRLVSRYVTATARSFFVITEADRSATTVLLPDEY